MKGFKLFLFVSAIVCSTCTVFAKELPVESFSQLPSFARPTLSPNGNKIGYVANLLNPEVAILATLDLTTGDKKYIVKSDNLESKINWFRWANERTIILDSAEDSWKEW